MESKDDEMMIKEIINESSKAQIVKVSVTGLLLSLDHRNDERLITEIIKETSTFKNMLTKTECNAKKELTKVFRKLNSRNNELINEKEKARACIQELNNQKLEHKYSMKNVMMDCKNKSQYIQNKAKKKRE